MPPWLTSDEKGANAINNQMFYAKLDNVTYNEKCIKAIFEPCTDKIFTIEIKKENEKMDNQLKIELSPPWETYVSELKALFENDDEVKVLYDHDNYTVRIYVDNTDKAEALKELMNDKIEIGNVTLAIDIIPSNNGGGITLRKNDTPWLRAFSGNSVFVGNESIHYPSVGTLTYVIWSATPAQFFNDNLGDWFGNKTILFEDIARRVFVEQPGVFHCSARMKHDYLTIR